jgi:hypothetical protein
LATVDKKSADKLGSSNWTSQRSSNSQAGSISSSYNKTQEEDQIPIEALEEDVVRTKDRLYENLNIQEKFEDFNARTKTQKKSKCQR